MQHIPLILSSVFLNALAQIFIRQGMLKLGSVSFNMEQIWNTDKAIFQPSFLISEKICSLYSSNPGSKNPRTFSNMTALGLISSISRIASGNKSRSSSFPSCLPATEKGGQGTPPASKSTPLYGCPSKSWTSAQMTFHSGRFSFKTLQ